VKNAVQVVKEGDALSLGSHTLHFYTAPMVHWPEVIVTYEESEKVLFAADGFGKFGALCNETDDWACEARRYYFNICGKYGASVQGLLKKAATLDIQTICPLHGPILKENLGYYIGLYDTWSKYEPETQGVFIAYCSLHGNTKQAALALAAELEAAGQKVTASDLVRTDMAECIEDAFRYDRMVLAAPTYDGAVMPVMEDFLSHLAVKTYRNRTVALVENGTWAPQAAKVMRAKLEQMKDITIVEPVVSIRSAVKPEDLAQLKELAGVLKK
jgi:flavorubredoxin